jgi:hypothetical protein
MYSIKRCKGITFLLKCSFFYMFYNMYLIFYLAERLPGKIQQNVVYNAIRFWLFGIYVSWIIRFYKLIYYICLIIYLDISNNLFNYV